jgi:hypothetical protein
MAVSTAVIAAWCVFKSGGDFGEFFGRFIVLFALLVALVLLTLWEKRSRDRAYETAWQRICHVLDGEHSHEGIVLRGTWKGRQFEAMANAYMPGPNTGMVLDYRLSMPANAEGPPWKAERAATLSRGSHVWTVRSEVWSAEERLVEAGLLDAIEEAEQRAVHFRPDIRLSFRPQTAKVAYEDRSGEPPCAADLVVHLDLVRRAVDVHDAAIALRSRRYEGGPPGSISPPWPP